MNETGNQIGNQMSEDRSTEQRPRHGFLRAVKAWTINILIGIAALVFGFLISNGISTIINKGKIPKFAEVELVNEPVPTALAPGDEFYWSPQLENVGKHDAYVYFSIECYSVDGNPCYAIETDPMWVLVDEEATSIEFPESTDKKDADGHTLESLKRTYAYKAALAAGDTTAPVFDHMTMALTNYQFYLLSDDFGTECGYFADVVNDEYTPVEAYPYINAMRE